MPNAPETLVALLRGINVGKAKRVTMADLRACLEGAGFTGVRTLLQSGNVVLRGRGAPAALAERMDIAFARDVGFTSKFTVLRVAELGAILASHPLPDAESDPSRLLVGVLSDGAVRAELAAIAAGSWGHDRVVLGERVVVMHCPKGQTGSALVEAVARVARDRVTTRNWATLTKLHQLATSGP